MTPLELASAHDIRVWPGGFVVYQYIDMQNASVIKAPWTQAHLVKALEEMNLEQGVTVVYAIRAGGTPLPLASYNASERRLRSMTPNVGTSAGAATVSGDYRRLIADELERIEHLAAQHPDSAFAAHFLDVVATARRHHPHAAVDIAHIPDGEIAHELEQRLQRLKRGFTLYILTTSEANGAVYETITNPDGSSNYKHADTQNGADWKAWDTLALEVYHLAQRSAPTPLTFHRVLEPWFTEATLLEAAQKGLL